MDKFLINDIEGVSYSKYECVKLIFYIIYIYIYHNNTIILLKSCSHEQSIPEIGYKNYANVKLFMLCSSITRLYEDLCKCFPHQLRTYSN